MDRSTLSASISEDRRNPLSLPATAASQREKGDAETQQEEEATADPEII
jgi:hypothetical protein